MLPKIDKAIRMTEPVKRELYERVSSTYTIYPAYLTLYLNFLIIYSMNGMGLTEFIADEQ